MLELVAVEPVCGDAKKGEDVRARPSVDTEVDAPWVLLDGHIQIACHPTRKRYVEGRGQVRTWTPLETWVR